MYEIISNNTMSLKKWKHKVKIDLFFQYSSVLPERANTPIAFPGQSHDRLT